MSTAVVASVLNPSYGDQGVVKEQWVKIAGLVGLSAAASETVVNTTVSPFTYDVYIIEALMVIKTVDAQDADLDIGIADDTSATGAEDNLFDSPANDTATCLRGLIVAGVAGVACPIWKASDAATNAYITTQQNGNVDASSLVYDLLLKVVPVEVAKATS